MHNILFVKPIKYERKIKDVILRYEIIMKEKTSY